MWLSHPDFKSFVFSKWSEDVIGNWEGFRFFVKVEVLERSFKGVKSLYVWGY